MTRHVALVVVLVCLASVAVPVALAGDSPAVVDVVPDEREATAGETVSMDLHLTSHGGSLGEGVTDVALEVRVDSEWLTVTDVSHGPFLRTDGIEPTTREGVENGTVTINQSIGGDTGVTGSAVVATLTLAIDEAAPPSVATIAVTNTSIQLEGDYPQFAIERTGEVIIDGGGDARASTDGADHEGVTLAENASTNSSASNATDEGPADGIPGPGLPVVMLAIATGLLLGRRRD